MEKLFGQKLGTVVSIDIDALKDYLTNMTQDMRQNLWTHLYKDLGWGKSQQDKSAAEAFDKSFPKKRFEMGLSKSFSNTLYHKEVEDTISEIKKLYTYATEFEQPLQYFFRDETFTAIGCANKVRYFLPSQTLTVKEAHDYTDITLADMRAKALNQDGVSLLPADSPMTISVGHVKGQLAAQEKEIDTLNQQIQDIKHATTGELAELQKEIERQQAALEEKKRDMLAKAQAMMDELELKKFGLETQIYMLDSEIYAMRCLLGETVNFVKLRSGQPAPIETPMVVYQKVRYLDEELARLAAIYDVDGEFEYIESFFKHSPYTFEFFVPAPRSVSLVRISRTGKTVVNSDKPGFENCLKAYDLEHGTCIGIMVRDGENLWMGWTDEKRVTIDEDLFCTEHTVVKPLREMNIPDYEKTELQRGRERFRQVGPMVSRAFVANILQGFIGGDNGIIRFPEPVNIAQQMTHKDSPYVIFSAADGWLEDNRYGTMQEIIDKCNGRLTEGDLILTTQHISTKTTDWSNRTVTDMERGRGETDRVHDCWVSDNTIYPLNLIECVEYECKVYVNTSQPLTTPNMAPNGQQYAYYRTYSARTKDKLARIVAKAIDSMKDNEEVVCTSWRNEMAYYVSVKKQYSLSGTARSNVRVYPHEFLNLTYANSTWIQYLLATRKTDDFRQFADAAKYLNTALQFVRKREEDEYRLISEAYPDLDRIPEWQVKLSEWKLKQGVRKITEYQARRFAKYIKTKLEAL